MCCRRAFFKCDFISNVKIRISTLYFGTVRSSLANGGQVGARSPVCISTLFAVI